MLSLYHGLEGLGFRDECHPILGSSYRLARAFLGFPVPTTMDLAIPSTKELLIQCL